ncbi:MAG TPA: helix-turn-helix transcriptional regulator [Verrucomicrobiae bacterium]|nr:helix-turn-helix transcriptional regulator [Verrucomicrobiae bacterium]
MTEGQNFDLLNVGQIIREFRKEKGITIVKLAANIGVGQAYISKLERGLIVPTKEQLEVIVTSVMSTDER